MDTITPFAGRPRDLLALVWYQLGYRPRDSLVLVGLHGPRRRAGVSVRVDLPGAARVPRRLAAAVAGTLRRAGAGAVVLLVVRDDAVERPPRRLLATLVRGLEAEGVEVVDVIAVGAAGYRPLTCSPSCCPPASLDDIACSPVAAAHVVAGDTVAPDEAALLGDVDPPPAAPAPPGAPPEPKHPPDGPVAAWEGWAAALAAGAAPEDPAAAAALGRALRDRVVRDAVLVSALGAPPGAVARAVAGGGAGIAALLVRGAAGHLGTLLARPPGARAGAAGDAGEPARVLAAVARWAEPGDRAGALAVLAVLAWHDGRGTRARLLVERAEADAPGNTLAGLVGAALAAGLPPPWAEAGAAGAR